MSPEPPSQVSRIDWWTWGLLLGSPTALVVWSALVDPTFVEAFCHEDGPAENATVLCHLLACGGFLLLGRRQSSPGGRGLAWLLAGLCLFVAGEEASWGQRLVGWSTPPAIAEHNVQGETNLHNLAGVMSSIRLAGVLLVLGLFVALPWLTRRTRRLDGVLIPSPLASATALVAVGLMFVARIGTDVPRFEIDEWGEFVLALAFVGFARSGLELPRTAPRQRNLATGARP